MKKIKILVCTHKPVEMPTDKMYFPIQVGASLTDCHWGIQQDNEGTNISLKNKNYSEITAHYWAWKNLKDYDYIGLAHYRRFLDLDNETQIENILKRYDIILPEPIPLPFSNIHNLSEILTREDVYILMTCIKKLYPEYIPSVNKYLVKSNINICCNMFITSKKIFEEYSKWLFDILFETEKYVKLSGYSRMKRIYGYYSEVLLPIYVIHNNYRIKYVPKVPFPGVKETLIEKLYRTVKNIRQNVCFSLLNLTTKNEYKPDQATIISMKIDEFPLF